MPDDDTLAPQAHLVLGAGARVVPVFDQLFIGRECAGIADRRRLVIHDPEISRSHLEIRLDTARDRAYLIDTSTNGTLLNGARLDRAVPTPPGPVTRSASARWSSHSGPTDSQTIGVPRTPRISGRPGPGSAGPGW